MADSCQYFFGDFCLDASQKALFRRGELIPLTPKSMETLIVLIERHGRIVDKKELMEAVWPETFVEEVSLARNISILRKVLSESDNGESYIKTIPKRGYRFVAPVQRTDQASSAATWPEARPGVAMPGSRLALQACVAVVGVLLVLGAIYFFVHHRAVLAENDSIVLADLSNTTGESVFDGTLRQALASELAQSPYLNIVSKDRMARTLTLMGEALDAPLEPKVARELCLRSGAKAVLMGSITRVADHYSLALNVDRCSDGESLANATAQANDKAHVLQALDIVATDMRHRLGESLASVQKYDTPIEQAGSSSLEALQAFSLGRRVMDVKGDHAAALPLFQGAVRLDSNFAMAYAALGTAYYALEEGTQSAENLRKAYALRAHVSERDRFEIEGLYYWLAIGDLEKAVQVYEQWAQIYPRDDVPPNNLGVLYQELGRNEKTLEQARECFRLDPDSGLSYANLVDSYLHLNRLKEARATAEEALNKGFDSPHLHFYLHRIAFLEGDSEGMARQVDWATGKPDAEETILESQAHAEAYAGHFKEARELLLKAVQSSQRSGDLEAAATYQISLAQSEALIGMPELARQDVRAAMALAGTRDTKSLVAMVWPFTGDLAAAEKVANEFEQKFPEDTNLSRIVVPTIRASGELKHGNPNKALELLATTLPYELGSDDNLYSALLRGQAFLELRRGDDAAREFQKLLDHRPVYQKNERAVIAQLGLARAYTLKGDRQQAREAYQKFLDIWKTADSNIPLLKQVKVEHARLQ